MGITNHFILSFKIPPPSQNMPCFWNASLFHYMAFLILGKLCSGGFTTMKNSLFLKCAILENIVGCILLTKVWCVDFICACRQCCTDHYVITQKQTLFPQIKYKLNKLLKGRIVL